MFSKILYRLSLFLAKNEGKRMLINLKKKQQGTLSDNMHLGSHAIIELETRTCNLNISDGFYTRAFCCIRVGASGTLTIGRNVFWNNYCSVNCMHAIEIGGNVLFGEGVKIYDHNHEVEKEDGINILRSGLSFGKVTIGNNCWLGSNVVILKGVTIGDNVVVGANCLVHKDIPANSIVKNGAVNNVLTIKKKEE